MKSHAPKVLFLTASLTFASCAAPPAELPSASEPPNSPELTPRLALEPCRFEGSDEQFRCGILSVAENPAEPEGRRIDLNIVVAPAMGEDPAPDPIFFLEGGPGAAAAEWPVDIAQLLGEARQHRDIVMVDQRGTGKSHPLDCPTPGGMDDLQGYFEDYLPIGVVEACRDALGENADLRFYTTPVAMDDVDQVRAALGYERINLVGGSYGTRAAQVYMRRHADRARSAILFGTAAMDQHLPLYHARDAQRSMDLLFEDCAKDAACDAAFPDLAGDFATVMGRLSQGPIEVGIPHPIRGDEVTVSLNPGPFAEGMRFFLYSAGTAVVAPLAIHQAAQGEFEAVTRLILIFQYELRRALSFGMHLSVTCAEDRPFYPPDIGDLFAGNFLGDHRARQILDACEVWPRGEIPETYHEAVTVPVPTLLVSGRLDPVTPPSWADEVNAELPNSLHVLIEHGHHGFGGLSNMECYLGLSTRFIEAGSVEGLDASCLDTMRRGTFMTDPAALEELLKNFEAMVWK